MALHILGRHRDKSATLDFSVDAIGAGLNRRAAVWDPQEIADDELTQATNVYLRADGGVEERRGVKKHGPTSALAPATLGIVRFYQNVVLGVNQAPTRRFSLKVCGGSLYNVDTEALIGSVGGGSVTTVSMEQVFDPNNPGGASDVLVICTGVGGPYLFDGTSIRVPAAWNTNIPGAKWVKLINGVLWFSGIPGFPNLIWGSALGSPESLPFYNEINLSQRVNGLGAIGQGAQAALAAGMNRGIAIVSGVGPSNFVAQEVPMSDGVMAGNSMIEVDGVLYYMGETAIYRYDGWQNTPISDKVEPIVLNDPLETYFPMNGNRAISWAIYYNRRIYFWYDSGNVGYTNTALVYDLVRKGWTIYSGIAFACGAQLLAPEDPDPNTVMLGGALSGQVYDLEVLAGGAIPPAYQGVSDDGAAILTYAQTKFFKLGDPGTPKTLLRLYPELFTSTFNGQMSVSTDYGATSSTQISITNATSEALWGTMVWGAFRWAASVLTYSKPRYDFNLQGEAFAISFFTYDTNPPWRWVGISGTFAQEGRQ